MIRARMILALALAILTLPIQVASQYVEAAISALWYDDPLGQSWDHAWYETRMILRWTFRIAPRHIRNVWRG